MAGRRVPTSETDLNKKKSEEDGIEGSNAMQGKGTKIGQKGGTTRHSLNRLIETVEAPWGLLIPCPTLSNATRCCEPEHLPQHRGMEGEGGK